MERQTKRTRARRKQLVPALVNERQLASFLSSEGGKNDFVRRMAETLRQAWTRIEELEGEPPKENLQQERDWQTCERVLVVSECDGAVEVFAESWVAVNHVAIPPWRDRDDVIRELPEQWRAIETAPNSRALIVPQIRSQLTDEALVNLAIWERRSSLMGALVELIRNGK